MFNTLSAALAIAIGASLGSLLIRPLHRSITEARNIAPFKDYMRQQMHADSRAAKFMSLIPNRIFKRDTPEE
ncbi:MAG TPA: hypothetical protein VLH14_01395 [Patescibacteria group bacterium]|nr:hypothetical protein [Patescibacteria group bacterium]